MKGYPIQMVLHSLLLALSLALMLIDLVPRLRFIISKERYSLDYTRVLTTETGLSYSYLTTRYWDPILSYSRFSYSDITRTYTSVYYTSIYTSVRYTSTYNYRRAVATETALNGAVAQPTAVDIATPVVTPAPRATPPPVVRRDEQLREASSQENRGQVDLAKRKGKGGSSGSSGGGGGRGPRKPIYVNGLALTIVYYIWAGLLIVYLISSMITRCVKPNAGYVRVSADVPILIFLALFGLGVMIASTILFGSSTDDVHWSADVWAMIAIGWVLVILLFFTAFWERRYVKNRGGNTRQSIAHLDKSDHMTYDPATQTIPAKFESPGTQTPGTYYTPSAGAQPVMPYNGYAPQSNVSVPTSAQPGYFVANPTGSSGTTQVNSQQYPQQYPQQYAQQQAYPNQQAHQETYPQHVPQSPPPGQTYTFQPGAYPAQQ